MLSNGYFQDLDRTCVREANWYANVLAKLGVNLDYFIYLFFCNLW